MVKNSIREENGFSSISLKYNVMFPNHFSIKGSYKGRQKTTTGNGYFLYFRSDDNIVVGCGETVEAGESGTYRYVK